MKILSMARQWTKRSTLLAMTALVVFGTGAFAIHNTSADVSLGGAQDCDANAVVFCGASSASQLVGRYNSGDGHNSAASIQNIYSFFGITSADIQAMPTTAVAGSVTKDGSVFVGNQLVATGALTAGRENIAGSTPASFGGTAFFTRPPSVSFASNSLTAYVVMSGGQFRFAVLSSCGNPVKATPTTPTPPPPPPAPAGQCTNLGLTQDKNNPREVSAVVTAAVQNGAALSGVSFNFGDGTTIANGATTTASHTYGQDGRFVVKATLTFTGTAAHPTVPPATCQAPISFNTPPQPCTCTSTNGGSMTCSGGNNTTSCQPPTPTPTPTPPPTTPPVTTTVAPVTTTPAVPTTASSPVSTLVNTGPGSVIGLFLVTMVSGTLGFRWYLRHKLT